MDYAALRAELDDSGGHPVTGVYNVDDGLAADELNAINVVADVETLSGSQLFEAIDNGDWDTRTADQQEKIKIVVGLGDQIQVASGKKARAMLASALSGATTSLSALSVLGSKTISRAEQLGLGTIAIGDVQNARAI